MPTATMTAPDVPANAIVGKLYDVLTHGDGSATAPAIVDKSIATEDDTDFDSPIHHATNALLS